MPKFPSLLPFRLRRNRSSFPKGGRRLAAWTAALGAIALVAGVLQTASAQEELITTTTTLGSSPNPSVIGGKVTFTATVTFPASGSEPVPTGTVDFTENDVPISDECSDVLVTAGKASCEHTFTAGPTTHSITAEYSDESAVYEGSQSPPLPQTVKAESVTELSSTPAGNTSVDTVSGQAVTYLATVASKVYDPPVTSEPGGKVTFFKGNNEPISANCTEVNLSGGQASCLTNFPASGGSYVVTAVYLGDGNFTGDTSDPITQNVAKAQTTTSLASLPTEWKKGQPVKYTAGVAVPAPSNGIPAPGGTVTFKVGSPGTEFCAKQLPPAGSVECSYTHNSTGSQTITATYSGDSNYLGSDRSITQVVNLPYTLTATGESANGKFTISGPRLANYRLCVRYFGYNNVKDDWPAVTPPPRQGSGIHRFGLNFEGKCKKQSWSSGDPSDTERLMDASLGSDDFGFATKGWYEVKWWLCGNQDCTTNGALIGDDKFNYDSWCVPDVGGFRHIGVWRPSRLKVVDSCFSDVKTSGGLDVHFDKDRSVNWGGWHNEFVARDWHRDFGPPDQPIGAGGNGYGSGSRRFVGVRVKDTYHHCHPEVHPAFMVQKMSTGNIFLGGPQYSTKTPSISGTWKKYPC
jgi:hypothetical protein